MFETRGIRTLIICGAVTLTTLLTQQILAKDLLKIDHTEIGPVPEGQEDNPFTFTLTNISGRMLVVSFSSLTTSFETGDPDRSDNIQITSNIAPGQFVLMPNGPEATHNVDFTFNTPSLTDPPGENSDFGVNRISDPVFVNGLPTGQELLADVTVTDPPPLTPVPESSTLVLVGACVLSVCGLGWLRRRRILSKA